LVSAGKYTGCVFYRCITVYKVVSVAGAPAGVAWNSIKQCDGRRAEPNFVLQGGLRDAAGNPRATDLDNPPLEFSLPNKRGTVTMARWEDPNSGAGEFFVNLGDSPHLDQTGDSGWALGFTVFGEVVQGLEVAERIAGAACACMSSDHLLHHCPVYTFTHTGLMLHYKPIRAHTYTHTR
jgi:cyclophilin family peptidyl-prolyl cis-trans isomerase